MQSWLAAAAAVPLVASSAANAQGPLVQLPPVEKTASVSSFRLPAARDFTAQSQLKDGMIAEKELAPNARLDVGLAPMLARNIHSVRIEQEPVPTRNPGVSLVIKLGR